jgi:hypothetical protein
MKTFWAIAAVSMLTLAAPAAASGPAQHRAAEREPTLRLAKARALARQVAKQIAPVFTDSRIHTQNRCRRVSRRTVWCRSVVRGDHLFLRYRTKVHLTADNKLFKIHWRDLEVIKQPRG